MPSEQMFYSLKSYNWHWPYYFAATDIASPPSSQPLIRSPACKGAPWNACKGGHKVSRQGQGSCSESCGQGAAAYGRLHERQDQPRQHPHEAQEGGGGGRSCPVRLAPENPYNICSLQITTDMPRQQQCLSTMRGHPLGFKPALRHIASPTALNHGQCNHRLQLSAL